MTTSRPKSSVPAGETAPGTEPSEGSAPEQISPAAAPDERAVSELITRGAEEIQDHLSLVAQIQVKISRLLEASIEELERAQRLETLTGLIAGADSGRDGTGPDEDSVSGNLAERPAAYLEREIKALKKMQKLLGIRARAGEDAVPSPEAVSRELVPSGEATDTDASRKVLIIYNDPGTVRVLRYFLEKENYEVLACSNGPDGLQKASRGRPDLILLDILLPGMDGYQVLGRLKRDEKTAGIPVFVLSVLAQEADILKAIEVGAADYFTKPFSPHIIIAKIGRALRVRHE
jgi:CheY-like chemotaxis protein